MTNFRFLGVVVIAFWSAMSTAQQVVVVPPMIIFKLDTSIWEPAQMGIPAESSLTVYNRKASDIYIDFYSDVEATEESIHRVLDVTELAEKTLADGTLERTYKSAYGEGETVLYDMFTWERVRKMPNGYFGRVKLIANKQNYTRAAKLWQGVKNSIEWSTPEGIDARMELPMSESKYKVMAEAAVQKAVETQFFGNPIETILGSKLDDIRQETMKSLERARTFSYSNLYKQRMDVRAGNMPLGVYFERIANYDYERASYEPTEWDYQQGRSAAIAKQSKKSFDGVLSFDKVVSSDTTISHWAFGTDTLHDMGYVVMARMQAADSSWSVKVLDLPISRTNSTGVYWMSEYELPDNPFVVLREPKGTRYWVGHPDASNMLPLPQSSFVEGQFDVILTEVQPETPSAIGTFFGIYAKDYTYDEIMKNPELRSLVGDTKTTTDFFTAMGTTPPPSKKDEMKEAERVILEATVKQNLRRNIDPTRRAYRSAIQLGDINNNGHPDIYTYQVSNGKLIEVSAIQLKNGTLEPIQNKRLLGIHARNTYGFAKTLELSTQPTLAFDPQEN